MGSDLWLTEPWVECGPYHGECPGTPGLGGWGTWEPAFPQRFPRGHQEGQARALGPMPGGRDPLALQQAEPVGKGLLEEWSFVINFVDSERIPKFVDKEESNQILPVALK